jgi:putative DNA primase/helicase
MIKGLERLIKRKYFHVSERQAQIVKNLKIESDSALSFIEDCCEYKSCFEQDRVEKKDLYEQYKTYCKDGNYKPYSNRRFYREIKAHYGFDEVESCGYWYFRFVKMRVSDMGKDKEDWRN